MALAAAVLLFAVRSFADDLPFGPSRMAILSANGKQKLGEVEYDVTRVEGGAEIKGEAKLLNGEHDSESARLLFTSDEQIPLIARYKHTFFDVHGAPQLIAQADFKTGVASCAQFKGGKADVRSAVLSFPPDTYAGASLMVPLTYALRQGKRRKIHFHAFSCVPDPRVMAVEADVKSDSAHWEAHPGELVEVEGKPDLGWLNLIASPFLPKFHGWFDPSEEWRYVGGSNERYYKGPMVQMVRVEPAKPSSGGAAVTSRPATERHSRVDLPSR